MKRDITNVVMETERIIRHCYEQLCMNKLDNLEENDTFQEAYNLSRLNLQKQKI